MGALNQQYHKFVKNVHYEALFDSAFWRYKRSQR